MNVYINPANAVTASRFITLPAFAYWLDRGDIQLALLAVIVCAVLDLFDGAVARAFHCSSGFGELFDAVADAVCYGFFMVLLAAYDRLPWIPIITVLALGALNSGLRVAYARRLGRAANYRSHAMERVVALAAYLAGFGVTGFEPVYFAWVFAALMAVVVAHDAKRMLVDPLPAGEEPGRDGAAA